MMLEWKDFNIFNRNSLSFWDKRRDQTIGFSLLNSGLYLKISHGYPNEIIRLKFIRETIWHADEDIFDAFRQDGIQNSIMIT